MTQHTSSRRVVTLYLCLYLASFVLVSNAEEFRGAIVTNSSQHNVLQFAFVQGGSINISFSLLPDTSNVNVHIAICSEGDYYKLIENDHNGDLCNNNKPKCELQVKSTQQSQITTVQHTTTRYGRYYIDVVACPAAEQEVVVNWTASFRNDRAYHNSITISHLNADLLPAFPASQAAALLWFAASLAYLGTLRHHWKRASCLQKCIAVYPIMKVVLSYYSGSFYSRYAERGYFTTSEWVWYWFLQICIRNSFNFTLMLLSIVTTGLDSSGIKIRDIAFIFVITLGLLVIAVLQCSYEVSQLSSLLMWMLSTTLYVMMIAYILSGVTSGLHKAGNILRSSIRRNVAAHTRRRLRDRRHHHLHSSIPSVRTTPSFSTIPLPSNVDNDNTNSNNTEIRQISEENSNNNDTTNSNNNGNSSSVQNSNSVQNNNSNNDNNNLYSTEQINNINNSISYLMPYIWFTRYNLYISFKFVVIVWVILNVVVYFVNLIFGTSSLNWVYLMTNELLDFIIFSGIIYSFLMCSRSPFSENGMKGDRNSLRHSRAYVPLVPTRNQQQQHQQLQQQQLRPHHQQQHNEQQDGRGVQGDAGGGDLDDGEDGTEIEEDRDDVEGVEGEIGGRGDDTDDRDDDEDVDGDEEVLIRRQLPISMD